MDVMAQAVQVVGSMVAAAVAVTWATAGFPVTKGGAFG